MAGTEESLPKSGFLSSFSLCRQGLSGPSCGWEVSSRLVAGVLGGI
jgi:hypothetical protein